MSQSKLQAHLTVWCVLSFSVFFVLLTFDFSFLYGCCKKKEILKNPQARGEIQ